MREDWLLGLGLWTLLVLYGFWLAYCEARAARRSAAGSSRSEGIRMTMQDLLYLFLVLAVFALAAAYVRGCDRL